MAYHVYNNVKYQMGTNAFDWGNVSLTFRILLVGDSSLYVPTDSDTYVTDFTGGGGVEVGARVSLTGRTVIRDDLSSYIGFDADDLSYPALNVGRVKAGLIYQRIGADDTTPADDVLIAYLDEGVFPFDTDGGDWQLVWSASGILVLV